MWRAFNTNLSFVEGDFGIPVQATVKGIEMSASDILRFTFTKKQRTTQRLRTAYSLN